VGTREVSTLPPPSSTTQIDASAAQAIEPGWCWAAICEIVQAARPPVGSSVVATPEIPPEVVAAQNEVVGQVMPGVEGPIGACGIWVPTETPAHAPLPPVGSEEIRAQALVVSAQSLAAGQESAPVVIGPRRPEPSFRSVVSQLAAPLSGSAEVRTSSLPLSSAQKLALGQTVWRPVGLLTLSHAAAPPAGSVEYSRLGPAAATVHQSALGQETRPTHSARRVTVQLSGSVGSVEV
jgi:hypothetical protein